MCVSLIPWHISYPTYTCMYVCITYLGIFHIKYIYVCMYVSLIPWLSIFVPIVNDNVISNRQ